MNPLNIPRENINPKELETEALPLIDWLYNFAFYVSADRGKAKKLIKRTYIKVLEYFDKTRGGANYKSWMVRVMLNRVYELYEKQRSIEKNDLDKEFLFQVLSLTEDEIIKINESLTTSVNRKILLNAVQKIPVELRLPLIFRSVLKFDYNLAAEFIDIPEGVIASRIFRARKWIFNELTNYLHSKKSQIRLEYSNMKMIASRSDEAQLHKDELSAEFSSELIIQNLIKKFIEDHLIPVKTPGLIKTRFYRKVKKLIKKSNFEQN